MHHELAQCQTSEPCESCCTTVTYGVGETNVHAAGRFLHIGAVDPLSVRYEMDQN